jgi:adenylate kinase
MNAQQDRAAWLRGGTVACELPEPAPRPYRLVLLGPPGVGKGTQAELLGRALGACHLSTGDLFRAARDQAEPSPAMGRAVSAMRRGDLVPDDVVVALVRERADCLRCGRGCLLDGFPRTVAQAQALDRMLEEQGVALDAVLSYELPTKEIVDRLSGRRSCPGCKAVYHESARPPRCAGVCDVCGARLVCREDDRPESIRVRLNAYEESTRPLADFYRRAGKLVSIRSAGTPEETLARTLNALEGQVVARPVTSR